MNNSTSAAFLELRPSGRITVAQHLDVCMTQGHHESDTQYAHRLLQMIEKQGKVRELEQALMLYR